MPGRRPTTPPPAPPPAPEPVRAPDKVSLWSLTAPGKSGYRRLIRSWLELGPEGLVANREETFPGPLHPGDRHRCRRELRAACETKRPFALEYRIVRPDGSVRWILDCGQPRFAGGKRFIGYLGSCLDVTDRREAAAALADGEERSRLWAELSEDTFFIATADFGHLLHATGPSSGGSNATTQSPAPGPLDWFGIVALEDRPILTGLVRQVARRGTRAEAHLRVTGMDGRPKELRVRCLRLPVQKGQGARVAALVTDVTEHRRFEAALRNSEERFQLACLGANDGIFDWNLVDHSIFFSPRWKSMLGYEDHELPSRFDEWQERLHPDERIRVLKYLEEYVAGLRPQYALEFRMRHRDGSYRWILARGTLVRDSLGQPMRMVGSHTEITLHKEQERMLLEATDRERRRIGHDLHDDLGQRFTALQLLSQALLDQLNAASSPSIGLAAQITESLRETITQVRRLSHGLAPMALEGSGLSDALQELANYMSDVSGREVRFYCPKVPPLADEEVATHLYRITQEAVNNSVKHGRSRRIDIQLLARRGGFSLQIDDDGAGFPPGDATQGRGLQMMKQRASLIGAVLLVQSRAGGGIRVSCTVGGV
jgi:PAS domain S-box-containing protein